MSCCFKNLLVPVLRRSFLIIGITLTVFTEGLTQDLEPRRWSTLPLGTNVVAAGYLYTNGEISFDPVLEAEEVDMNLSTFVLSYVRPFKVFHNNFRIDIQLPYVNATWNGIVSGTPAQVKRNGIADPRVRLSYNIMGPPSNSGKEYVSYIKANPVYTTIGMSLAIRLPFGNYLEDKLLNIGSNRITFRPQIGMVHTWNKWSYEITGSAFIFGANNEFFNGNNRTQKPMLAIQSHLNYQFSSTIWSSLGLAYGGGGITSVNDNSKDDLREDILFGYSIGVKLKAQSSLKLSYLYSATQQTLGNKLNTFALIWINSF